MTPEQFVYWLQGFMEMANPSTLNETQTQQIKDHLKLVFDKKTPIRLSTNSTDPIINPTVGPNTIQPYNPLTGPDWTWKPNPYTVTCTTNDLNDLNKKIC